MVVFLSKKRTYERSSDSDMILTYKEVEADIKSRLNDFKKVWAKGTDEDIFTELVFCLLTPQSKALSCWEAVERLSEKNLIIKGTSTQVTSNLAGVRFCNNKGRYVVEARKLFLSSGKITIKPILKEYSDKKDAREWLVKNVNGMGYKEASHFLRNIGMGEELAILDRHILKNLNKYKVIKDIPTSLSRTKYIEIEAQMKEFSNAHNIPMAHLDLLFWYNETGKIFK
jgi:N-glycosylase/DNA lyase